MMWGSKNQTDPNLERDLRDVQTRLAQVESEHKRIRTEWEETFEKVMAALRRLGKRARDAADAEVKAAPGEPGQSPAIIALMARREAKFNRRRG